MSDILVANGDTDAHDVICVAGLRPAAHNDALLTPPGVLQLLTEETRDKVYAIEREMRKYPQLDLGVKHYFSQGVYARELFIPKGTLLTGKIHKFEQLNIMSMGDMSVLVGDRVERVKAPFTVVSPPGTKRIAYAHEDTLWTTVHGTELRDLVKIEEHFIAQSEAEYLEFSRKLLIEMACGDTRCLG